MYYEYSLVTNQLTNRPDIINYKPVILLEYRTVLRYYYKKERKEKKRKESYSPVFLNLPIKPLIPAFGTNIGKSMIYYLY